MVREAEKRTRKWERPSKEQGCASREQKRVERHAFAKKMNAEMEATMLLTIKPSVWKE